MNNSARMEVIVITPAIALQFLEHNRGNRSLNKKRVANYAREIAAGAWMMNGENIKFARSGRLLDGQHRLHAVVLSQMPIVSWVAYGLDEDAFATIDINQNRSGADTLTSMGEKNARALSAALALVWAYANRSLYITGWHRPVNRIIKLMVEHHRGTGAADSAQWAHRAAAVCSNSTIPAGFHYLFSLVDKTDADRFMEDLSTGANLSGSDPVFLLRERLIADRAKRVGKLPRGYVAALFIKAWNLRRAGGPVKALRLRLDGSKPESFPEISELPPSAVVCVPTVPTAVGVSK